MLSDLAQLAAASGLGATVFRPALLLEPELTADLVQGENAWHYALSGGDDYELLFTATPHQRAAIESLARTHALPITAIGEMTAQEGLSLVDDEGATLPITQQGWEHR